MTIKIGILGLGFMGKCHFDTYAGVPGARVAAICDVDAKKRSGDWSGIAGNIGGAGAKTALKGIRVYADARKLFADPEIDVIDIALPTHMHAPMAIAALRAGKHVICEKPMAISSAEAKRMVAAAKRSTGRLFIAHCIRFWPCYANAREIIRSGRHGKVLSAVFTRVSSTPTWSWKNWLMNPAQSGGAALDLHIHDADFVLYTFGKPKRVTSHASGFRPGRVDHIVTSYEYAKNCAVVAEGAWDYAPGFGFSMSFRVVMEKATLCTTPDCRLMLHPVKGRSVEVKGAAHNGYQGELKHFVECIRTGKASAVVSPRDACQSVQLVEAEMKSARTGKAVAVRF